MEVMFRLGSRSGEKAREGMYQNNGSSQKSTIEANMSLAGKSFHSRFKFPPATAPTLALILIGILPGYLKDLYGPYAELLMQAYVTFGYLFMIPVIGGLSIMVFRERAVLSRTMKTFKFRPGLTAAETDRLARVKVPVRRSERE